MRSRDPERRGDLVIKQVNEQVDNSSTLLLIRFDSNKLVVRTRYRNTANE